MIEKKMNLPKAVVLSSNDRKPQLKRLESKWSKPIEYTRVKRDLINLGLQGSEIEEVLALVRRKLLRPRVHLRFYYLSDVPEIEDGLLYFPEQIDNIQTGDLIAFSGVSPLAVVIMSKDNTTYSHVGIALRVSESVFLGNDPKEGEKEKLFIVESTQNSHEVPDYFDGKVRHGVTIFLLEERLRRIDSNCAWHVPLLYPLVPTEVQKLLAKVRDLYFKEVKYDMVQLWPFYFGHQNKEDLHELFCSECASLLLRETGRLKCNPSRMTPNMVVTSDCFYSVTPKLLRYITSTEKLRLTGKKTDWWKESNA